MLLCRFWEFSKTLCPARFFSLQVPGWQPGRQLSQAVLGWQTFCGNLNHPQKGHCPFPAASFSFCFGKQKASFFSPKALELFAFSKAEAFPKHHFSHPFPKEANPAAASHGQQAPWHPLTAQLRKVLAGHLFSRSPHASKCMWLLQPSGWPTPHHCGLWCSSVVS